MKEQEKKYILENINKKSIKDLGKQLGLKERTIKRFLERQSAGKPPQGQPQSQNSFSPQPLALKYSLCIILALLVLGYIIYSHTFLYPFQFDDTLSITENPGIRHLYNLQAIWGFYPTRFITYLSLAFNYHFGGLNVLGYHIFNLTVHLGCALLVFWLSFLTFLTPFMKTQKISRQAKLIAFFTALVFLTHPIQTQGVTYIIQRAASLATLFYLAAISLYVKSRLLEASRRRSIYYAVSLIAAIIAMFTKEIAFTLPLMICLYELSFFKAKESFNFRRVIPFLLCLSIIPLTMFLTKSTNIGEMQREAAAASDIPSWNYLLTQFKVMVTYIRLLFLPFNQNLDYDYPVANTLLDLSVLASLFFLAAILIFAKKLFRNYRLVSFGILWFFIALLVESSVMPIKDVIFEHRLYLPMFGYSIFLTSSLYYLFEKKALKLMVIALLIITSGYAILTYRRNFIWKDALILWNDVAHKSPNKTMPYYNRGLAYAKQRSFDQAISDFTKAIEIYPNYAEAYYNRGIAYYGRAEYDLAWADVHKAEELGYAAIHPDFLAALKKASGREE
jgi:tetratricopeptide (TPR) repeat protein